MLKRLILIKNLSFGLFPALLFMVGLILGKDALAAAKTEFEIVCRSKAKEAATEVYKTCVTENRNAQIDTLKKEYQDRLKSMKEDYEKELSKIAGKPVQMGEKSAPAVKESVGKKSAKGKTAKKGTAAAKKNVIHLPMTAETNSEVSESRAIPVQEGQELDIPEPIPVQMPEDGFSDTY